KIIDHLHTFLAIQQSICMSYLDFLVDERDLFAELDRIKYHYVVICKHLLCSLELSPKAHQYTLGISVSEYLLNSHLAHDLHLLFHNHQAKEFLCEIAHSYQL